LTTVSVNVAFDPKNPLVVTNSYATTNAQRVALDFDLAASNTVTPGTPASGTTAAVAPAVVAIPYFRFSNAPADNKLIRVRGPLVNSNLTTATYSVYERPFFDESNNIGTLSLFSSDATIYTINGTTYVGPPGLAALQQTSAGVTTTLSYTNFQVTPSSNNGQGQPTGTAGIFHTLYMIAGGSLETSYTENLTGEVIARNGDLLTLTNSILAGSTVALSQGYFEYLNGTILAQVHVGPSTVVTAEGNATLTNLNSDSIGVGQRISAIGTYTAPSATNIVLDAVSPTLGSTAGQVRLMSTTLYGLYNSSAAGSLSLNLQAIDEIPISQFNFAGNGATTPNPAAFVVDTSKISNLSLGTTAVNDPLWVDGFVAPFGSAPPDFLALPNLYRAPTPDGSVAPVRLEADVPASMQVLWPDTTATTGTKYPFATLTAAGLTINLAGPNATTPVSAVIQIGAETIPLGSLSSAVTVVPNTVADCVTVVGLPAGQSQQPCNTNFSFGPIAVTPSYTTVAISEIQQYSGFADFIAAVAPQYSPSVSTSLPVLQFTANGYFNRATNTFTANSIDVVL
jgi:hypothetical protein